MEIPWEGGTEIYINGPGHDQDGRHIRFGKNFENLILQNRKSYDLETWQILRNMKLLKSKHLIKKLEIRV